MRKIAVTLAPPGIKWTNLVTVAIEINKPNSRDILECSKMQPHNPSSTPPKVKITSILT